MHLFGIKKTQDIQYFLFFHGPENEGDELQGSFPPYRRRIIFQGSAEKEKPKFTGGTASFYFRLRTCALIRLRSFPCRNCEKTRVKWSCGMYEGELLKLRFGPKKIAGKI